MGTKAHPSKYDCESKAKEHEPKFTLLGRDRFGSQLVRMWIAAREQNYEMAARILSDIFAVMQDEKPERSNKTREAVRCAHAMEAYWLREPYCYVCLCVEGDACLLENGQTCAWANKEQTVCTNPACLKASGLALNYGRGDAEALARKFHEIYERQAPFFGYTTKIETRTFNPESNSGRLMIAVCEEILRATPADLVHEAGK